MDDMEESEGWALTDEDRNVLKRLNDAVFGLKFLARGGTELIALGEVLKAIEQISVGEEVDEDVELSVGFRRGDQDFEEGLYINLRINDNEIILDELNTTYSSDVGSDHFTRDFATLRPQGNFNDWGVNEWLDMLKGVLSADETELNVSRNHL